MFIYHSNSSNKDRVGMPEVQIRLDTKEAQSEGMSPLQDKVRRRLESMRAYSIDIVIRNRARRVRIKREVIGHYSDGKFSCNRCRFSDMRALSIDHINGGGSKHRREVGVGNAFYNWLRNNHYPNGYQVLCLNCQFITRHEQYERAFQIAKEDRENGVDPWAMQNGPKSEGAI